MKLPDPLARRHLLDGTLEASKALAIAKAYLEEDREVEAVDFLAAANADSSDEARAALVTLQEAAVERGDVFLMKITSSGLKEEPSQKTWQALADSATREGRSQDAETATRLATVGG